MTSDPAALAPEPTAPAPHGEGDRPVAGAPEVRVAPLAELDAQTLYGILRLRVDVFVVEQNAPYHELDGRDLEPDARLLWIEDAGGVLATARLLRDTGGVARIGRVVTAATARGRGLSGRVLRTAIALAGDVPIQIDAQAHLAEWYSRFGFVVNGEEFLEDGIPHLPMRREAPGPHTSMAPPRSAR